MIKKGAERVGATGKILTVLSGEPVDPPPVWIMRQAGRYLPEYRETRKVAGSFLDLCYNPELAAEVTLQPIRRFDLDAAILFSDILVIPDALGQRVTFEEGVGPVLDPVGEGDVAGMDPDAVVTRLAPVLEAVRQVRAALAPEKALIGFCGAPWTVATYMVAGRGTPDQAPARRMALLEPERFARLIDVLVEASARYLSAQIAAGADVVMIFDTWAGILDEEGFETWAIEPVRRMIEKVRSSHSGAKVIAFPKGAGARLGAYAAKTGADAFGLDWTTPIRTAHGMVPAGRALQGNLDPLRLIAGGEALDRGVDAILAAAAGRPHIFNLGHGITPDTPIPHVERLVARVRRER
ncbi:uroporphyrinogen decarboxylase [Propylenella binzhouense]|uniref:Uroporphyrinogen decarboxylase n=1 Tax=Propylenella binzhouense TaxID=2555902 RepID=A0A964T1P8_9HYPH|nr:uroporphyrinogen decarboxylase [Propylenella binzhouense]MYZ46826.1 uroporphyrinogen decarboxylase [Propylenella binzhouense]